MSKWIEFFDVDKKPLIGIDEGFKPDQRLSVSTIQKRIKARYFVIPKDAKFYRIFYSNDATRKIGYCLTDFLEL